MCAMSLKHIAWRALLLGMLALFVGGILVPAFASLRRRSLGPPQAQIAPTA